MGTGWREYYITLATDDILISSNSNKPLQTLNVKLNKYFTYTVKQGFELTFLDYISDQSNHIDQTILRPYFKDAIDKSEQPKFQSAPFPINPKFEVELF